MFGRFPWFKWLIHYFKNIHKIYSLPSSSFNIPPFCSVGCNTYSTEIIVKWIKHKDTYSVNVVSTSTSCTCGLGFSSQLGYSLSSLVLPSNLVRSQIIIHQHPPMRCYKASFLSSHSGGRLAASAHRVGRTDNAYIIIIGSTALRGPWPSSEASVSWGIRLLLLQISWWVYSRTGLSAPCPTTGYPGGPMFSVRLSPLAD
jgi:hypothetical protein